MNEQSFLTKKKGKKLILMNNRKKNLDPKWTPNLKSSTELEIAAI